MIPDQVEELPSGVRTIVGVATSIAAFVGRALRGPVNQPVVVNSFGDFEREFGGLWAGNSLGYAVRELAPLRTDYRGFQLLGLSPTSGSMTAFEALNILSHFDLASMGAGSADAPRRYPPRACLPVFRAAALRRRAAGLADPRWRAC